MFAKRQKPWFVHALVNLAAAALIYRTARWFQKIVAKKHYAKRPKPNRPRSK
jgi:hypothetical protein